jgi:cytosine/adenosine deaminase-related metal-dependent hydrolase
MLPREAKMKTLITGGYILTLDSEGRILEAGDLLIDGDRITDIGPSIAPGSISPDRVIQASGKLVMPGLINAHMHSWNVYLRGMYDDLPLDILVPYLRSINARSRSPREAYVRTMHCALEMLKGGITTAVDILNLALPFEQSYEAIMTGYRDIGIRAAVGISLIDRRRIDTIPFLAESLPPRMRKHMKAAPVPEWPDLIQAYETLIDNWHGRDGRLQVLLTPSGPQRCTDELMMAVSELAQRKNLSWHMHVLETRTQLIAGYKLYGDSIVSHLAPVRVGAPVESADSGPLCMGQRPRRQTDS